MLSHVRLCDPMDRSLLVSSAYGILRQEYCSGLLFPHQSINFRIKYDILFYYQTYT